MSRSLNKVQLIGHLGKDVELRALPSGSQVASFSMATSSSWKDKDTGDNKERTEWHRISAFGKLAEIMGEYLRKGAQVYIEGELRTRKWQDKEGNDRYTTEIVATQMLMLGQKGEHSSGGTGRPSRDDAGGGHHEREESSSRGGGSARSADDLDDDIPFGWAAMVPFAGLLIGALHVSQSLLQA